MWGEALVGVVQVVHGVWMGGLWRVLQSELGLEHGLFAGVQATGGVCAKAVGGVCLDGGERGDEWVLMHGCFVIVASGSSQPWAC